jgi:AcrR family transcriptional regulator
MPAISKVSQQDIIDAAFSVVSQKGWAELSARSIAKELNSSTMPIYHRFKSMVNLEEEIVKKIMELLKTYQSTCRTGDKPLDRSVGYVLFAREEPHLFQAINDELHSNWQAQYGDPTFDQHTEELSLDPRLQGLAKEQLRKLNFLLWIFIHGIASLKNWMQTQQYDEDRIIELLCEGTSKIIRGFLEEHKTNKMREFNQKIVIVTDATSKMGRLSQSVCGNGM